MRTKSMIRSLIAAVCLLAGGYVQGQATVPGNSGGLGDYVGWDAGTTIPLEFTTFANYAHEWRP